MPLSNAERQARYRAKVRRLGRVEVRVSMSRRTRDLLRRAASQDGTPFNAWCLLALTAAGIKGAKK